MTHRDASFAQQAADGQPLPWEPDVARLTVDGTRLRLATVGHGRPLLLLNGIGGNIEMWEPLARHIPDRRLIMVDMPGTGGSPELPSPRRMRGYARLIERLLDALDLQSVDVLGYSWGGALAQQLAHQAPARVGSLVLAATTPGLGGRPPAPWVVALMLTPVRYYSRTYLRLMTPLVFGSDPAVVADSRHGDARLRRPPTPAGYAQQLFAITGWSSRPWLRTIKHRTLVVAGRYDRLVPQRNATIMTLAMPNATLRMISGGHLFLVENPALAGRLIERFLTGSTEVDTDHMGENT